MTLSKTSRPPSRLSSSSGSFASVNAESAAIRTSTGSAKNTSTARSAAFWPASSPSKSSTTVSHSRRSTRAFPTVIAVPSVATAFRTPA